MFTLRKLQRLPYKTRLRKMVLLLQQEEMRKGSRLGELLPLFPALEEESFPELKGFLQELIEIHKTSPGENQTLVRGINNTRNHILKLLGAEPAEWDMIVPETGELDSKERIVRPFRLFLEDIRSPFNVGAIFRSAESFGVEHIYLSPETPLPTHKKARRTSRECQTQIPWSVATLEELPEKWPLFAMETGGISLEKFPFPEKGILLIGSEELGISPEAQKTADNQGGRVTIPMGGAKNSLNVSVAFGIVMYNWFSRTGH